MLTRTEGIVLKNQKYGEADLIVTYLTSDRGIINAFARSPRKTKSRFGSSLEPLTHSRIALWGKEQSLPKITQSDIIASCHELRENFHDFANISKLIEILISLVPEGIPNKRLFTFILNLLQTIRSTDHGSKDLLHLITIIRLLATIGYAPRLKGCGKCGKENFDFYPSSGTTLCRDCSPASDRRENSCIRINSKVINFYSHTLEWPINIANRLKPDALTIAVLSDLLDKHVTYLLSKKLRSAEFLTKLTRQV